MVLARAGLVVFDLAVRRDDPLLLGAIVVVLENRLVACSVVGGVADEVVQRGCRVSGLTEDRGVGEGRKQIRGVSRGAGFLAAVSRVAF